LLTRCAALTNTNPVESGLSSTTLEFVSTSQCGTSSSLSLIVEMITPAESVVVTEAEGGASAAQAASEPTIAYFQYRQRRMRYEC
jgi:hypothetical protein